MRNNASNSHPLIALYGAVIITLAGIAREIGIDTRLDSIWKAVLYFFIILAIAVMTIVIIIRSSQ